MKQRFTTFCFLVFVIALKAQTTTTPNVLPTDFPIYVNTGNPTLDAENYSNAKKEWIKNHPAEYKAMNQVSVQPAVIDTNANSQSKQNNEKNPVLITKEVFKNCSAEKQKYILEHPTEYTIVE